MKLPAESASSWVHMAFAVFTHSSLIAWAEVDVLAAATRVSLTDFANTLKPTMESLLKEARETQDAQIFARPTAQARQNVALTALNRATKESLQLVTMKLGESSEDHPNVRTFLPKLTGGITKLPMADRPDAVVRASQRLSGLPDFEGKAQVIARLEAAATNAERMMDEAALAFSGWQTERSEEVMAKGKLRLALQSVHGGLINKLPGQREFVESFFLRAGKASEGEDEDGGEEDGGDAT